MALAVAARPPRKSSAFTGNLDADVKGHPPFPGKERESESTDADPGMVQRCLERLLVES